jgi:hypothetical protein
MINKLTLSFIIIGDIGILVTFIIVYLNNLFTPEFLLTTIVPVILFVLIINFSYFYLAHTFKNS